jgi:SNF2 family DNA or RNA helicase
MPEANIKVLTTIVDHQKLTWNDVLEADIVITSLNFLQNKSYDTKVRDLISKETSSCPWYEKGRDSYKQELYCHRIKSKGKEVYGKEIGKVVFEHVFWYRIVCDEFHELGKSESKNKAARCFLKDLKGRFYLGVTGTPATNTARDIGEMAKYLNCDQEFSFDMAKCFVQQKIRRNEPNLELPPVENRCIWVELSVEERGLYIGMNDLTRSSLMACNHHQLADDILDIVGDGKEMSVEEVAAMVQKSRLTNIAKLSTRISNLEKSLEEAKKDYNEVLHLKKNGVLTIEVKTAEDKVEEKSIDSVLRSKLTRCESIGKNISEVERERANIQSQYNFFQTLLDAVQEGKQQNCLICLEDIVCGQKFSVGRCGHVYCCPCLDLLMASAHPRCGACRVELKREDIARIAIKKIEPETEKQEQEEKEDGDPDEPKIDYSKYGSKLGAFVEFATKTIQEEPDAKIVLFIQWRHLMKLVSKSLNEFNVNHVTCDGNVFAKSKAVTSFKTDPNVKLILLSAEDSVSGLHLTEANYVVIFHPFLMDSDKQAMDYEYQGIARSRRFGQTRTVKVVRFLVKDSVEEVLAKRRKYENAQLND